MRDIRPQLRQRLRDIGARRRDIKERFDAQMAALDRHEAKLKALLPDEDIFVSAARQEAKEPPTAPDKELTDLVLEALPSKLEHLKKIADQEGWPIEGASPGRAINFLLVGLQRRGQVKRLDNGEWRRLEKNAPPVVTDVSHGSKIPADTSVPVADKRGTSLSG